MKKIIQHRLNLETGQFEPVQEKIKVKNFDEGEAAVFFRQHLESLGHKISLMPDRSSNLYGVKIRYRFVTWQAIKDNDTGKAVFWIGAKNPNALTQEQLPDATLVNNRIVKHECDFYALVVIPRGFSVGMSIAQADFIDYILFPFSEVIKRLQETGQSWVDIRKIDRQEYSAASVIHYLQHRGEATV